MQILTLECQLADSLPSTPTSFYDIKTLPAPCRSYCLHHNASTSPLVDNKPLCVYMSCSKGRSCCSARRPHVQSRQPHRYTQGFSLKCQGSAGIWSHSWLPSLPICTFCCCCIRQGTMDIGSEGIPSRCEHTAQMPYLERRDGDQPAYICPFNSHNVGF